MYFHRTYLIYLKVKTIFILKFLTISLSDFKHRLFSSFSSNHFQSNFSGHFDSGTISPASFLIYSFSHPFQMPSTKKFVLQHYLNHFIHPFLYYDRYEYDHLLLAIHESRNNFLVHLA